MKVTGVISSVRARERAIHFVVPAEQFGGKDCVLIRISAKRADGFTVTVVYSLSNNVRWISGRKSR